MISVKRLGHVFLVVRDIERSRKFYTEVLGFKVMEDDPDHGGVFLSVGEQSHTLDLVQSADPDASTPPKGPPMTGLGVQHVAFQVDSHDELRDAYFALKDNNVKVLGAIDHNNQESVYFHDPDENVMEIYWERPNSKQLFAEGRHDRDDQRLVFEPRQAKAVGRDRSASEP